jgi:hypothetical protein
VSEIFFKQKSIIFEQQVSIDSLQKKEQENNNFEDKKKNCQRGQEIIKKSRKKVMQNKLRDSFYENLFVRN